jgi:hypothetical protein
LLGEANAACINLSQKVKVYKFQITNSPAQKSNSKEGGIPSEYKIAGRDKLQTNYPAKRDPAASMVTQRDKSKITMTKLNL